MQTEKVGFDAKNEMRQIRKNWGFLFTIRNPVGRNILTYTCLNLTFLFWVFALTFWSTLVVLTEEHWRKHQCLHLDQLTHFPSIHCHFKNLSLHFTSRAKNRLELRSGEWKKSTSTTSSLTLLQTYESLLAVFIQRIIANQVVTSSQIRSNMPSTEGKKS